jgi:hypothetical protein
VALQEPNIRGNNFMNEVVDYLYKAPTVLEALVKTQFTAIFKGDSIPRDESNTNSSRVQKMDC